MYKVKTHYFIKSIKKQWLELEKCNNIPVYQTYYVQHEIFKRLPVYSLPGKYKPLYCEVIEDGKTVLIAPLCKHNSGDFGIIGQFNGIQSYDFIYDSNIGDEKAQEYLDVLLNYLGCEKIHITNMPETSLIFQVVKGCNIISNVKENSNVCIEFGEVYDNYYMSLSKHARQNIRTSYNRMNTDSCAWEFKYYMRQDIECEVLDSTIDLYCKRHKERYGVTTSKIKKLYLKKLDFSTYIQRKSKNNIYATLFINGNLAAFMSGVLDFSNRSAVIPRLSINNDFSKYSPGIVLINEMAKVIINDKSIDCLDLSKGDEKYKYQMGGKEYKSFDFDILKK